jgi:hypothetical protein
LGRDPSVHSRVARDLKRWRLVICDDSDFFAAPFLGVARFVCFAVVSALVCDDGDLSRVSIRVGGHEYNRSCKFADPASVVIRLLSRPLLESLVRRRVRAIDNVEILDGHDVVKPVAAQSSTGTPVLSGCSTPS